MIHVTFVGASGADVGKSLNLVLAAKAMPLGTDSVKLATTNRALPVPRSQLRRPYPTAGEARVACA